MRRTHSGSSDMNASHYRRFVRQEYSVLRSRLNTKVGREFSQQVESLLDHCLTLSSPSREYAFVDGLMRLKKYGGDFRFRSAA